jgi:hypothetical protein
MSGIKWAQFTKRTNDPKLKWLEEQLDLAGVPHRRNGCSWHAPILEIDKCRLEDAWSILDPVDDIPDSDPRFGPALRCRYYDCVECHPTAGDDEPVTCPTCRKEMGLD